MFSDLSDLYLYNSETVMTVLVLVPGGVALKTIPEICLV